MCSSGSMSTRSAWTGPRASAKGGGQVAHDEAGLDALVARRREMNPERIALEAIAVRRRAGRRVTCRYVENSAGIGYKSYRIMVAMLWVLESPYSCLSTSSDLSQGWASGTVVDERKRHGNKEKVCMCSSGSMSTRSAWTGPRASAKGGGQVAHDEAGLDALVARRREMNPERIALEAIAVRRRAGRRVTCRYVENSAGIGYKSYCMVDRSRLGPRDRCKARVAVPWVLESPNSCPSTSSNRSQGWAPGTVVTERERRRNKGKESLCS